MRARVLAMLCVLAATSCKPVPRRYAYEDYAWEGVPPGRLCSGPANPIHCLSEGHAFLCLIDDAARKVVCQRLSTDIVCTRIVDVEAKCAQEGK